MSHFFFQFFFNIFLIFFVELNFFSNCFGHHVFFSLFAQYLCVENFAHLWRVVSVVFVWKRWLVSCFLRGFVYRVILWGMVFCNSWGCVDELEWWWWFIQYVDEKHFSVKPFITKNQRNFSLKKKTFSVRHFTGKKQSN